MHLEYFHQDSQILFQKFIEKKKNLVRFILGQNWQESTNFEHCTPLLNSNSNFKL
jgi:hypothetical protein